MSKIKVNQIEAATGSTITVPSGQTLDISSATISLPSTVVTTTGTQTLTNKTLTSATFGGTGISASGNIVLKPFTNILEIQGDGSSAVGKIQLNCPVNSHGQKIASQPHAEAATNTLTLPGGNTIGNTDAVLVSDSGIQTITNKTLTAPKIASGGFIADANGNEQIKFTTTASAVNEFTVINSATGSAPEIQSTGSDTNIDLKITPKGSGKIVLDGISFPNADGSANQVLQTNGSGVLSFASPSGGKVLQVLQAYKTDTFTQSSVDTWSDVTGLSVSITPASASNKILVMGKCAVSGDDSTYPMIKLVRNSTDIYVGDAAGSRIRVTSGNYSTITTGNAYYGMLDSAFIFLDTPATVSATTYKVQLRSAYTTASYINRVAEGSDNQYRSRGASSIIVMEISAW